MSDKSEDSGSSGSGSGSGSESESDEGPLWYCYMLASTDRKKTYVGATVNPDRRLRQHNGEISGGARATKGRSWRRVFLIGQFASEVPALKFEWRWKYLTRQAPGDTWLERRTHALSLLVAEHPEISVLEENLD